MEIRSTLKRNRTIALLSGICLLLVAATASAQQPGRLSLPGGEISLSELFAEIKRQAGSTVIFEAGNVPQDMKVSLQQEGSVEEILDNALPKNRYDRQAVGSYIVVRTLPPQPDPVPVQPVPSPQPSLEDFERNIREYTRNNILQEALRTEVRYDTIRTEKPHSGVFDYPSKEMMPLYTSRPVRTPFQRNTPPLFAVKTNLLWWAAGVTLNIGGELGLGKRTSLELAGGYNRRNLSGTEENNRKLAHWVVKPEFRYWLCERFNGHFFGVHALYGQYNVGGYDIPLLFEKEYRYEGSAYGAGINYGYHLPLSGRWGLEFAVGAGMLRLDYSQSDCIKCGDEFGKFNKIYFGPTEIGVKVVFMIK